MSRLLTTLTTLFTLSHTVSSYPTRHNVILPRDVTNTSKAGLAGGWGDAARFAESDKISWYYTWSPYPQPEASEAGLEFIPMLWGQKHVEEWANIDQILEENNVTTVLGMNEPEYTGQANMTPAEGAAMWREYIEPLKERGVRLGSVATTSGPLGKNWTRDWLDACDGGCNPDFMVMHSYNVNATRFIADVEELYATYQKPVWVTEWSCHNYVDEEAQCSMDDMIVYLNKTQTFLDETEYVERYAWFGVPGIINADAATYDDSTGEVTPIGEQYMGERTDPLPANGNAEGNPSGGAGNTDNTDNPDAAVSTSVHWGGVYLGAITAVGVGLLC